jgi:FtsP/CotA-like multicopper oxidase with cupredoxin domain
MTGGPHAGHGGGEMMTPIFSINGQVFPDIQALTGVLDTTQEWTIFEVKDVDGTAPEYRALQDTINIPAEQTVTVRLPLEGHAGTWMFHCHILEHAERGMMGELHVSEP